MTIHHPKECRFCLNPPVSTPLDEMERHGVKIYFCYKCSAEYLYWPDEELASWSLYVTLRDRMYRWTVSTAGTAQLWYIKDPGIPATRKNANLKLVIAFSEDIPTITPENFLTKLATYLVFI